MPRSLKYRNSSDLAALVVDLWGASGCGYIKQVAWDQIGVAPSSIHYVLSEIKLCLLKPCTFCGALVAANAGATKYCSGNCRRNYTNMRAREATRKDKATTACCKICGGDIKLNPKASRKKRVCSHRCHLILRNWAQSTVYSERRKADAKNWYEAKGKEYGAAWRMKHKDKILSNQRRKRTGSYGYKYEVREKAIKSGYRSAFEQSIHGNMLSRNINPEYETHKLKWVDTTQHTYTPDFILKKRDGSLMFVEAKGYLDSKTRSKMLCVQRCNPELDIRFLFQYPKAKLKKGSKTSYADWAERHGFKWCGPVFSEAWAEELADG